uniref:Uncharacterized protein n=1 Tax=Oryza nivara TaxID=4536 RepID=A0A0E0J600_ORYNI
MGGHGLHAAGRRELRRLGRQHGHRPRHAALRRHLLPRPQLPHPLRAPLRPRPLTLTRHGHAGSCHHHGRAEEEGAEEDSGGGVRRQAGRRPRRRVRHLPGRLRRRRQGARAPQVPPRLPRRLHRHVARRAHVLPYLPGLHSLRPCRSHRRPNIASNIINSFVCNFSNRRGLQCK